MDILSNTYNNYMGKKTKKTGKGELMVNDFVHLHLRTEYSLLQSSIKIKELFKELVKREVRAIAITDYANLFGAVDFYKEAKKYGIKAIIGVEMPIDMPIHTKSPDDIIKSNVVLLAKNKNGYKNIVKMLSLYNIEQINGKKHLSFDRFKQLSNDIVVMVGNERSYFHTLIKEGKIAAAKSLLSIYKSELETSDVYVELNFGINDDMDEYSNLKLSIADFMNISTVATADVSYLEKSDSFYVEVMKSINSGKILNIEKEETNSENYLKTSEKMQEHFKEYPKAILNTIKIANKCKFEFDFDSIHMPEFQCPANISQFDFLKKLCKVGLKQKYGIDLDIVEQSAENKRIIERLEYELSVVKEMNYSDYFLIVCDFVNYAKRIGVRVGPGRGSGGGSIICYCLNITEIDPIRFNLIFERFLNPDRVTMPDIDIDFQDDRRAEVIEYVVQKYGKNKVANIITFSKFGARIAIRDVGRVLNILPEKIDRLAKMIPSDVTSSIEKQLKKDDDFIHAYNSDLDNRKMIDIARKLEGLVRHVSTHAAGIIITKDPVMETVPVYQHSGAICTQYNMSVLENLGLLKIDFLGLKTLTIIENAISSIKDSGEEFVDFDFGEFKDPKTFTLLSRGATAGIFQLESKGMIKFLKELKPRTIEDIIIGISIYRPGPMDSIPTFLKNRENPSLIKYKAKELIEILKDTNGCLVFQEQVMEISKKLAGYSYAESDMLRRAMSKKQIDVMQEYREKFISGALERSITFNAANMIFDEMAEFAKYAFNKSHATGYAILAYECSYLKSNYPVHYMASLLSSVSESHSKIKEYVSECKKIGIDVIKPDIRYSDRNFKVEDGAIRYGLSAIKYLSSKLIDRIIEIREEGLPKTLIELYVKIGSKNITKRALEFLSYSGALDFYDMKRSEIIYNFEEMSKFVRNNERSKNDNQISMETLDAFENESKSNLDLKHLDEFPVSQYRSLMELALGTNEVYSTNNNKLALYIRLFDFSRKEKLFIRELKKDENGFSLIVKEERTGKSFSFKERVYLDDVLINDLIAQYGVDNVVVKR